jgi:hypothetical protein
MRKSPKGAGYSLLSQLRGPDGKVQEKFAPSRKVTLSATKKQMLYQGMLDYLKTTDASMPVVFRLQTVAQLKLFKNLGELANRRFKSSGQELAFGYLLKEIWEIAQHRSVDFIALTGVKSENAAKIEEKELRSRLARTESGGEGE